MKRYLPFKHGVPCKNTFSGLFASINPEKFKTCFLSWIDSFQRVFKTVTIDGKTRRHSHDKIHNQSAIHLVSAFATEARLVLGQLKVSDQSNEITAISKLLNLLDINGLIITIDAMSCQKDIAGKITDKQRDYILALKGNQGVFAKEIREFLETEAYHQQSPYSFDIYSECDKGKGFLIHRPLLTNKLV